MSKNDTSRMVLMTKDGLVLTMTITKVIKYCTECPFHEQHAIVTPDSFEHDTGVYCSLVDIDENSVNRDYVSHTYDGEIKKRFCFSWEWASEIKQSVIPDWCPLRAEARTE